MGSQRKPFWGGLVAILLGSSCCWLTSITIWVGGVGLVALVARFTQSLQVFLIVGGIVLLIIAWYRGRTSRDPRN